MRALVVVLLIAAAPSALAAETAVPRSMAGDKGQYFLLETVRKGRTIATLHKRIGVDTIGFTRLEIDCAARRVKDVGYGEGSVDAVRPVTGDWYDLVPGSSKSDVAAFACSRK